MGFLPGPMELVIILIIVAMLFGVGRLPEVFGAVGKGLREFRREVSSTAEATPSSVQRPAVKEIVAPGEPASENQSTAHSANQEA